MIFLYPFLACFSLLITIFSMLVLNWIVVLFVDAKGNLPPWLSYFQTFDAPLPTGYLTGVMWLMRNPTYGFDYFVFGIPWDPDEWTVQLFRTNATRDFFIATSKNGGFNFYYLGTLGMYKFGWKAWNCFDSATGKFSGTFGDGSHVPICITFNPFKTKV
ncbi:DUF7338 family protein [Solimicrobium silvestre]|uniref:Uncharacterized protein n=1 Tax=Solimicrobium silvestre TaxID=2099400 RepID=A0A2S9GY79_9BURK|nr:hypothetical protein [Solimicrobium silvestre]PRC92685.1 hypothetical protein S2091_2740 [Solimicrobium silvestre]